MAAQVGSERLDEIADPHKKQKIIWKQKPRPCYLLAVKPKKLILMWKTGLNGNTSKIGKVEKITI